MAESFSNVKKKVKEYVNYFTLLFNAGRKKILTIGKKAAITL